MGRSDMATKIDYLDETWNPISMRCDPVSPGCANCWHLRMANRHAANPSLSKELREARAGGPFCLLPKELEKPLHWKRPRRIGVQFMGDLFHENISTEWVLAAFEVMALAKHTFAVLTKRPGRALHLLRYPEGKPKYVSAEHHRLLCTMPMPNVWLGVTCENQEWADKRIPILLQIPAAVRWVSCEPLLSAIQFDTLYRHWLGAASQSKGMNDGLDWVVVGCESGPHRRECRTEWIQDIISQCHEARVSIFVKQVSHGGHVIHDANTISNMLGRPIDQIRQFPKCATGQS